MAILLVSSKLEEVQGLSDRLAVVYEGEFIDVVDPDETTEEELGLLMAGERPGEDDGDGGEPEAVGNRDDGGDGGGPEATGGGDADGTERETPTDLTDAADGERA